MVEKLKRDDQILMGVVSVVLFLGCFAMVLMFWKGYTEAPLPPALAIFLYPLAVVSIVFATLAIILFSAVWTGKWPPFKFMENWK